MQHTKRLHLVIDDMKVECDIPEGMSLLAPDFHKFFVHPCLMALQLKLDPTLVMSSIVEIRKP